MGTLFREGVNRQKQSQLRTSPAELLATMAEVSLGGQITKESKDCQGCCATRYACTLLSSCVPRLVMCHLVFLRQHIRLLCAWVNVPSCVNPRVKVAVPFYTSKQRLCYRRDHAIVSGVSRHVITLVFHQSKLPCQS
ncbi:hypothetical protein ElyMa_003494500 [Elysia marginata]|uniref:Uncharacterized protein n=1 Tax=Elysia marginata TaxID=1093978 RepID=A0AAV4EEJ9_9GAST|nr:hypothetical protein ElyMa_003494500 [Elysia marginata]